MLVVILGSPDTPAQALADFHHLWWFAAAMAVASGRGVHVPRGEAGRRRTPDRAEPRRPVGLCIVD